MFRRILVGDNERALVIRKKRLADILGPGEYWMFTLGRGIEVDFFNVKTPLFASDWADTIVNQHADLASRYFTVVETGASQAAVVYLDGKVARVVAPSKRELYWKAALSVTFDLIDVAAEPEVPARLLAPLARLGREAGVSFAVVEEGKRGLLFLDGRLVRELGSGSFGFWTFLAAPRVDLLETRRQMLEVPGQEVLTKDKVTIRVNISAIYEITDATVARKTVKDASEYLYRTLQIAVRQTLGKRTLEEVLAEKTDLDEAVSAEVRREMQAFGVAVGAIALKDIVLPGDIREILNQVVAAEKQAQANLIRRREETAATRSLLNTAKLMEDNPLLVRLKELETLEKVTEKVDKITVIGGLNALIDKTITLRAD
jgi:regulator of protease activity HflC (stomatin/prohibitin superfamily)